MCDFLLGSELWANICGGLATAAFIALFVWLKDRRKHKIIKDLTRIMGNAIEHRNIGERKKFKSEQDWVRDAKALEEASIQEANKLSSTTGAYIQWLDRIPLHEDNEVDLYIAILSMVIERIREIIMRNS